MTKVCGFSFLSHSIEDVVDVHTFDELLNELKKGNQVSKCVTQFRLNQNSPLLYFMKNFGVVKRRAVLLDTPDLTTVAYGSTEAYVIYARQQSFIKL